MVGPSSTTGRGSAGKSRSEGSRAIWVGTGVGFGKGDTLQPVLEVDGGRGDGEATPVLGIGAPIWRGMSEPRGVVGRER